MSEETLFDMETFFMALADKTRLRLLNLMRDDEVCVCFFTEVLNLGQPKISRHLAYLRKAGIVKARREGKWMHYRILEPENAFAANVLHNTLDWLKSQSNLQTDYQKLSAIYRISQISTTLIPPPRSYIYSETNISKYEKEELETYLL